MSNKKTFLIFTDDSSSMDPEDTTAPLWLYGIFVNYTNYDFHVVISGPSKKTNMDTFFGKKFNLEKMPNVTIHQFDKVNGKIIYPTLNKTIVPDHIINISAHIDNIIDFISLSNLKSVAIMGNKSSSSDYNQINPNVIIDSSFHPNDIGADKFHKFLIDTQTPVHTNTIKACKNPCNMLFMFYLL